MTTTTISEDVLWELVESIWDAYLGPIATCDRDEFDTAPRLSASVRIGGRFRGLVHFSAPLEFASWATAHMLKTPEGRLSSDDVDDALGELCNIIGGGVKSLLPGPSTLSLPRVTREPQTAVNDPRWQTVARLPFSCRGQTLYLQVLEEVASRLG